MILHVICIVTEKVPLGMLCGIVKSRLTADADGETNKRPLIHSKVKTVGCVSPKTLNVYPNMLKSKTLDIFVVSKIKKYKIIAFGRDFGKATFRTILAKRKALQ